MPRAITETDRPTEIVAGLRDLAPHYAVVLCDVWGVVHDGTRHFPAAVDALARFRRGGGTVILITNAPRPKSPILAQLRELAVPSDSFDDMVTSGDATIALIAARGTDKCFHIGPPRDLTLFEEAAAISGRAARLTAADEADYIVCTGLFDDDSETPADYDAVLRRLLARGCTMICANPDIVVHRGDILVYCSGALAERYAAMGGDVLLAGKPHPPIYRRALELATRPGAVLAIGDGVPTDLLGAHKMGLDALFVTNGIHRHLLHPGDAGLPDLGAIMTLTGESGLMPRYAIDRLRW